MFADWLDTLASPFQSWIAIIVLILLAVGLIGGFVYMRMNKKEE